MVKIRKCQSRKHKIGGCGDPKCPEGLSVRQAILNAAANGDFNAYSELRNAQKINEKKVTVYEEDGFLRIYIHDDKISNETFRVKSKKVRPDLVKEIENVDKTIIPSFNHYRDIEKYVRELYAGEAHIHVQEDYEYLNYEDKTVQFRSLAVTHLRVSADLRGLKVGSHMRSMVTKYADEHNLIITGTPTNAGDGSLEEPEHNTPEWNIWRDKALSHREGLERFYVRNGYVRNPCWTTSYSDNKDYLTGENITEKYRDDEFRAKFNRKAQQYLSKQGMFIRFPNGTIPKEFLDKTRTKLSTALVE